MTTFTPFTYAADDAIATITFSRPDRMNALTQAMEPALREACPRANHDDDARAVILTSSGRAVCAGMDIDALEVTAPAGILETGGMRPLDMNLRADYQSRYGYLSAIRKPAIAAINGVAAGLRCMFAACSNCRTRFQKCSVHYGFRLARANRGTRGHLASAESGRGRERARSSGVRAHDRCTGSARHPEPGTRAGNDGGSRMRPGHEAPALRGTRPDARRVNHPLQPGDVQECLV